MYYSNYLRGGGCASCSVNNNSNFRNAYSPEINNNRYINNFNKNSNNDLYRDSFNSYNNRIQRILTPPRNYSINNYNLDNDYSNINRNAFRNYYSPTRNTGCKSCSLGPSNIFNGNNYQRPNTGNILNRQTNNIYTFNNNNNSNNNNYDYLNRSEYNFKKSYNINGINTNNNLFEKTYDQNRYYSPLRSPERPPERTLINSFSSSNFNNNNSNNYLYRNNINNYNNNKYNSNKDYLNRTDYLNNKFKTRLDDRYNSFLNDNNNNYNNNRNNNNNRANYYTSYRNNFLNNRNNNYYSNSRFNYLLPNDRMDNNKFKTLNYYNYQRTLRDLVQDRKTFFLFIYGSHDYTGQSWCSDCNIAMPNVNQAKNLVKNNDRDIYFIDIPIDKINMRDLGDDPIIRLEKVPTLIYFENGMERNRLIENDLFSYQSVNDFILQAYDSYEPRISRILYHHRNYY
jgi:thiol-disulfide isomerase/thioredoxin